ncbi:antibiotic biosynthesis monooxygenase [Thermosporothrix hazakensis]|jgi:quinol monooxygenase YgiN|uniref:Antibiotic biosynthesis monooxygenase n=1 Tax=Thermosporothrix hazakensis TaxID=644383 RepID=A0A326UC90_THEHA|nr:antibiotic biosynthesis monooxygenase [Thermosporothrix hazakensis]PZW35946.1 antibiotic biosynthesis monooxygenase [Thermosporothrix hazakensis]GCE46602.1 hypothetical protein KTH_14710 [Thermosporothrix hazakensis]
MFVVTIAYRAKNGEEDAVLALHEDWQRRRPARIGHSLSWELLRRTDIPREFLFIGHFENQEAAQAILKNLEQDAWYSRLISLLEREPTYSQYYRELVVPQQQGA